MGKTAESYQCAKKKLKEKYENESVSSGIIFFAISGATTTGSEVPSEWTEWGECSHWCGKGNQMRHRSDENGKTISETKPCSGEDLKCALMLGVPAIIALIVILSIIFVCRNRNNKLERGRKALQNYRSVFGQKQTRQKPKRKTSNQTSRNGSMESLKATSK